ncbi:MAG: DUF1998 domain-containing protein [Polyangiaceae bacterium]
MSSESNSGGPPSKVPPRRALGSLRPSQVIYSHGVGSIVDLPNISAMMMGLDDWQQPRCQVVSEERLLAAVQEELGPQVVRLLSPMPSEDVGSFRPSFDAPVIGVPVAPFPRYLRCPICGFLGPLSCGLFKFKPDSYRPDRTRYVHENCAKGNAPTALPARFLLACERGHLDDFPWDHFVHRGITGCRTRLELFEAGVSGEAVDVIVKCTTCNEWRRMSDAFGDEAVDNLPACRGRRPHLRDFETEVCKATPRAILLGASNSWFGVTLSVLSLPISKDPLPQLVEERWAKLGNAKSPAVLEYLRDGNELGALTDFTDAQIWAAIQKRRANEPAEQADPSDIKGPEWALFSRPDPARNSRDFRVREVPPPTAFAGCLERVVLVERLREVAALVGFTRILSRGDLAESGDQHDKRRAPLARGKPTFTPASEVRGEGVFVQFKESSITQWMASEGVSPRDTEFFDAHCRWRAQRNIAPPEKGYPGIRYVMLHSFAHALMRQFALECGYNAASLRERVYAREQGEPGGPMAGVLIYTAAPDSEGTLGGLVSLGEPGTLGRHLGQMLEQARLCAADPLCAEHSPADHGMTLHGAACHACSFTPETSCERGNRYLDRALLVTTLNPPDIAFFRTGG